jgi:HlyD family secretion protein
VEEGQVIFALEQDREKAARAQAAAQLSQAEAQLANLTKGRRKPEIDALEAQRSQADAALRLSSAQLERIRQLASSNVAAADRLDTARASFERDQARVAELSAQIASARMSARSDEIRAAEANVEAARAALEQADWRLSKRVGAAAQGGIVTDTTFRLGETVGAGAPVVSILPPDSIKVRVFVPQAIVGGLKIGQPVMLHWDGAGDVRGHVTYVAPQAEFTPPVIYSRGNREKLVFLVEAVTDSPDARLHPGQPVEVRVVP